jgi:hypothetical protein
MWQRVFRSTEYIYMYQSEMDRVPVFFMRLVSEPEGPIFLVSGRMLEMSFKGKRNFRTTRRCVHILYAWVATESTKV